MGEIMENNEITAIIRLLCTVPTDEICQKLVKRWLQLEYQRLNSLPKNLQCQVLISRFNYYYRSKYKSAELVQLKIKIGDIGYWDFGETYLNESGFQHLGLVLSFFNSKAFVLPLTSNPLMYEQSYCPDTFPLGKKHLFRLSQHYGLAKPSVIFLNDGKYLNTARLIRVVSHIPPASPVFHQIKTQLAENIGLLTI